MRRTNNARRGLGIRGQLMFFLCFICLFLLVLFWILSTQLLEPLYTRHIERQLTTQAENVVSQLDDALAEGTALSSWSFGRLYINTGFFDKLAMDLYSKGALSSFCVDISDSTLRQIYKIENQSYCNLHETYLSDASSNEVVNTAIAMRKKCRTSPGGFKQTLNPPRLSGSAQLLVGRTTADGSYTVLVTTSLVHVAEASNVLRTLLPLAAALIFVFAMSAAWLFSEWFTKPLRQLSRAARQMAKGNYAVQVESRRSDELGDLAQDFNHMAEEVQRAAQIVEPVVAVHGADDRHVYAGPQHGTHDVGHGAVAVHNVILPVADDPFECAEVCQKALAKHHRRDTERGRAVGKIAAAEAHELHVDDLTEIFQQGVNMRPGTAGVAPADEVDYFHFALQSTCAHRKNTV